MSDVSFNYRACNLKSLKEEAECSSLSITKKNNIEFELFKYCLLNWTIFSSIRPAELGEYWKIYAQLPEQYGKLTTNIFQPGTTILEIIFFEIVNVCIMT